MKSTDPKMSLVHENSSQMTTTLTLHNNLQWKDTWPVSMSRVLHFCSLFPLSFHGGLRAAAYEPDGEEDRGE